MEILVKGFLKFRTEVFVTQTDPGELFILRNAGKMVPP